jgi:hypothetical protein
MRQTSRLDAMADDRHEVTHHVELQIAGAASSRPGDARIRPSSSATVVPTTTFKIQLFEYRRNYIYAHLQLRTHTRCHRSTWLHRSRATPSCTSSPSRPLFPDCPPSRCLR